MKHLICPKCHRHYTDRPALSRKDNETLICPICGMKEALSSIGIGESEQAKVVALVDDIHKTYSENM